MSNTTNGIIRHGRPATEAICPTCESEISRDRYERILRIDEARQKQLAEARDALQQERQRLVADRASIAKRAVESERVRLSRLHEKERQSEARKREGREKKLTEDAARAMEEKQAHLITELRAQVKTVEERRRRDEETLKQTISALQAKAEVRDRAHFGPEGEEEIVRALREQFPGDRIEHRGKKGDILHTVVVGSNPAATIVYEVKKTRGWQISYLRQTKAAMEDHGTTYGILVSRSLPGKQIGLCILGGVIVAVPSIVIHVVAVLRNGIIGLARLRLSEKDKAKKTSALFEYLRGDEFLVAIRKVQERIAELRESLGRERSYHDGWWRTREQHYGAILREAGGIDARVAELIGAEESDLDPTGSE